jgi:hypothetical protein
MCLDVLIFDLIPVEGNDTFQSEIEAHQGPRSASIRLDPPRVDFHWDSPTIHFLTLHLTHTAGITLYKDSL